jgi:hypothetical protein
MEVEGRLRVSGTLVVRLNLVGGAVQHDGRGMG